MWLLPRSPEPITAIRMSLLEPPTCAHERAGKLSAAADSAALRIKLRRLVIFMLDLFRDDIGSAVRPRKQFAGFGVKGKADFWIDGRKGPTDIIHVAFRASGRAIVRSFYEAAMAAGGRDNGAPGVRPHYHEHYYGAFVLDPDGHNIEAVCHEPFLG